jgi:predicted amidohydrolase
MFMTKHPKIAAIQMTSVGNVAANLATAKRLLAQAAKAGAGLAVLPEMFPTLSVENGHIDAAETFGDGPIQTFLAEQARLNNLWIVAGTIPIKSKCAGKMHAACLVYNNQGEVVTRYDKIHLFDANLCEGKEQYCESQKTVAGDQPIVFNSPFGKIGLAVCYDLRFPELFRILGEQGAEIFLIPSAFVYTTGLTHWDILCRARAIENLSYVVAANQVGQHPNNRVSYGHSMIVDPWGGIIAEQADGEGIIIAEIDLDYLKQVRKNLRVYQHRKFCFSTTAMACTD